MTEPKDKKETLSVGAKTYLKSIARELIYGFKQEVNTKGMRKGIECEDDSIALLNTVYFKNYKKNTRRINTDCLSGECDIEDKDDGIDIKTSWSLATFPCLAEDAHDKDYEWQVRAYMHLYNKQRWSVAFCMVNTPEELRKYEQEELHVVDHIDPRLRVTSVMYERDMLIEEKMLEKCYAAQRYIEQIKARILEEHDAD